MKQTLFQRPPTPDAQAPSPRKKQPSDQDIERFLQIFDQLKPHILWIIIVTIAIYDYFHPANVVGFLVLIAAAAGAIPLSQAIALLQGRSMPTRLLSLSEEKTADEQDEPGGVDHQ